MLTVVDGTLDDGTLVEGITVEDGSVGVVTVEGAAVEIVEDVTVPGFEVATVVPGRPIIVEEVTRINEDVTAQPGELTEALYWK